MAKLMNKLIDPIFKRKINKRLDAIRKTHIESLPKKSFAKKFQDKFKSRKDMGKERALIRFKEDKSMHDISLIRNLGGALSADFLLRRIARKHGYNIKEATDIHQHPMSENTICKPSATDLITFGEFYIEHKIHKFQISYMDNNNIKEIGRTYLQIKQDKRSVQALMNEITNINKLNNKSRKTTDNYNNLIECFNIKQIGLNGYKYNLETKKFIK
ncbi:MAG: hypothetical protein WCF78_02860 [archaeon]